MSAEIKYSEVINRLKSCKAGIRCNELVSLLEELSFSVRSPKSPGHKIITHDGLAQLTSASFDCGHGKNPMVKQAYIVKILRILRAHEEDLISYLRRKAHD